FVSGALQQCCGAAQADTIMNALLLRLRIRNRGVPSYTRNTYKWVVCPIFTARSAGHIDYSVQQDTAITPTSSCTGLQYQPVLRGSIRDIYLLNRPLYIHETFPSLMWASGQTPNPPRLYKHQTPPPSCHRSI
ncbi:unnamed protein product, partial [Ectocarpus sp. 6 AP-2014]